MNNPIDSPRFKRVISTARHFAFKSGADVVQTGHLLQALAHEEHDRINNPRVYKAEGREDGAGLALTWPNLTAPEGKIIPQQESSPESRLDALEKTLEERFDGLDDTINQNVTHCLNAEERIEGRLKVLDQRVAQSVMDRSDLYHSYAEFRERLRNLVSTVTTLQSRPIPRSGPAVHFPAQEDETDD